MVDRVAGLDSKVLLAIQAGAPSFVKAHKYLKEDEFLFRAVPTVLQKLEIARDNLAKEYTSSLAVNILDNPQSLDLVTAAFNDTQREVTDIHVRRLVEKGVLGEDHAITLYPVIEAAYLDCAIFVTTEDILLSRRVNVSMALIEICGMNRLYLLSPEEIVSYYEEA